MRTLLLSLAVGMACSLTAQEHFCNTTEMQNKWFEQHPEFKANFDKLQQEAANAGNQHTNPTIQARTTSTAASNYTVPVVFHILHTGGSENISDAQIMDAMSILTRDYNKRNPDTADVVLPFKNLIGDPRFEFQLATRDPQGNCTNGIIRHWDTNTDWTEDFNDYIYTWNATKYLNVYVVKTMGNGAAGYTYLPGTSVPASADAVVILSTYVGSIGSGNVGTSRALTHEVGHWFNLQHTWGGNNQPGVACGDDGVNDTPITKGFSSCNLNNAAICNPPIIENMQNYMDYAYCQRMFTKDQTTRMITAMNSTIGNRNNLSSSTNLTATGITNPTNNCVPQLDIAVAPTYTTCTGKPLNLVSYTYNAVPSTYLWTGNNDAFITNPSFSSTAISFTSAGTKTVNCTVSNSFGSSTKIATVYVKDGTPNLVGTDVESFEGVNTPTHWTILSPTSASQKWQINGDGASQGVQCAVVPGESFNANAITILESPSYDFKNNPGATFTFKYAYAKQTSTFKDVFKVQASKNCGGSWTDVYVPSNSTMASGSGGVDNVLFYPSLEQWKLYDITTLPIFAPFKLEENVVIRFFFQEDVGGTGHGNRFYLDEINYTTPVGINELTKQIGFNVYPNPATSAFNLSFNLPNAAKIKYEVVSVTGAILISEPVKTVSEGAHEFKLNENGKLSAGIYFMNLEFNGVKMSKKIIIN